MTTVIKTAHGRVTNALRRGQGVRTPFGQVYARPLACQMCGESPKPRTCHMSRGTQSQIQAHHWKGYGTPEKDLTVVFVCRRCHAIFHRDDPRKPHPLKPRPAGWCERNRHS
jgi:hypothetical protein